MADQTDNFEKSIAELETIVSELENGGLSLEQSLQAFERGVVLTRQCQSALQSAEQRVQAYLVSDGALTEIQLPNNAE